MRGNVPSKPDHIPVRRQPPAEQPPTDDGRPTTGQQRPVRVTKDEKDRVRKIRIAAILLAVCAVLVLIAMISYTSRDEANAQLTLRDVMGVFRGDEGLRVRFETTHNWLGLLGAVISHWMYTSTYGLWSLSIPVLMLFWARDVYNHQKLTPLTTRRSLTTIAAGILLAGFIGTLQIVPWMPSIDRVWSGAIGQFLAGIVSPFIGTLGSSILYLAAMTAVIVYGFRVDTQRLAVGARLLGSKIRSTIPTSSSNAEGEVVDAVDGTEENAHDTSRPGFVSRVLTSSGTFLKTVGEKAAGSDDDEPAEMLTKHSPSKQQPETAQDTSTGPIDLSGSVRILRPSGPGRKPPVDEETATQESNDDARPSSLDIDVVQQRLRSLHPTRDIQVRRDVGPSEPGDEPELPLFVSAHDEQLEREERERGDGDDIIEDTMSGGERGPQSARPDKPRVVRPLTVTVEDTSADEPEVDIRSSTLYDEHIVYKQPPATLLNNEKEETGVTDEELQENARILQEKLETFRVRIENLTVQPGPVVTQYEFVPASGIKVSQIESLADDIALALKAQGVRIIAPIPGRGTVGIEIPNHKPAIVRFSSIIKSPKYHNPDIKLPIAMGKSVVGEVYCADLAKMPHLLIAGATGKGKSVGINTIIASLLYRMHPRDLKFVIIDPKRVEMSLYAALKNHFMAVCPDIDETIITEPSNAVTVLKSVVEEMQQRYTVLAAAGQRNIADYNRKALDGSLGTKGGITHRPMPYIVVVIDELADLMMTASKEVEEPIVRLAQLARAVGIHCIVATQRPSVDVVTGLIKANFPARIAYQVASRIDSRTILDASGAEHLIGNGDMLFNPGNMTKPMRMQNAFISTDEVEAICEHIGRQKGYSSPYMLPSINNRKAGVGSSNADDRDELFEDAARIFIQLQQASVSTLQRRLKIGYARAARIVDDLESAGIVGPLDGARGRQVLLMSESELEAYL